MEFALGAGVLVLPVAMLVLVFPTWIERQSAARLAAQEAARAVVLADDCADGRRSAALLVEEIAANHELADGLTLTQPAGCAGELARGAIVTATVTVQMPLTAIPLIGRAGGFSWTVSHSERVDQYRSLP
ncbi:MAG TPA: hypothetical protein VML96_01605 [Egibacteraceae bacterium]|nr:hypothetical protein [Egibacteraceae bacterium]